MWFDAALIELKVLQSFVFISVTITGNALALDILAINLLFSEYLT